MRTNTDATRLNADMSPVPFGSGWNVAVGQMAELLVYREQVSAERGASTSRFDSFEQSRIKLYEA